MSNKEISILLECENCKKRFPNANLIKHKKEFNVNGQSIFLTYYDCPHCSKRHFLQIDDVISLQELTRVTTEFTKLAAMRKKGKKISKKQSDTFMKSRQHLSVYRRKLMEDYTDKSAIDESGVEYILRFSV